MQAFSQVDFILANLVSISCMSPLLPASSSISDTSFSMNLSMPMNGIVDLNLWAVAFIVA